MKSAGKNGKAPCAAGYVGDATIEGATSLAADTLSSHALSTQRSEIFMRDATNRSLDAGEHTLMSRRQLLRALGIAAVGAPLASALGQGRCLRRFGSPGCDTTAIRPLFEPTGWKTVSLDHITFQVADYQREAAFYHALMGWTLRSDDGKQAVMDIGDWGSVILEQGAAGSRTVVRIVLVRHRAVGREESRSGAQETRTLTRRRQRQQGSRVFA